MTQKTGPDRSKPTRRQPLRRQWKRPQAEGKAVIEAAVGKAQQELQTLRAKSDEKAKADAETLAAETKNKEAAMRIKAKTNLDRAASLIVERIVNG